MTIQIKGLSALAAATVLLLGLSFLINPSQPVIPWIIVGVGAQSMAVFGATLWALRRSNKTFFSIFVGDALVRLAVLGLATVWLKFQNMPYTAPLLSLAFTYVFMSFIQIPFFFQVK